VKADASDLRGALFRCGGRGADRLDLDAGMWDPPPACPCGSLTRHVSFDTRRTEARTARS
jgi:hypothetical protein